MNKTRATEMLMFYTGIYGYLWGTKLEDSKKEDIIFIKRDRLDVCDTCIVYRAGMFADTWIDFKYSDFGTVWSFEREALE